MMARSSKRKLIGVLNKNVGGKKKISLSRIKFLFEPHAQSLLALKKMKQIEFHVSSSEVEDITIQFKILCDLQNIS